ncbi:MAG: 5'-nucleotidase, partial [Haliea sp.]
MAEDMSNKLVIAISSRALFDLNESHRVFQEHGLHAYSEYQIAHEEEPLQPGEAFPVVQKLLRLNTLLGGNAQVEVVLLSRNSADTGLRVFNSIQHYELPISRAAFCGGESPWRYINAFGCQLFLSNEAEDVRYALDCGVAAATLVSNKAGNSGTDQLRFAFDGDAVVFSDEAERVYKTEGLEAFAASEQAAARTPLSGGPFKPFLAAL